MTASSRTGTRAALCTVLVTTLAAGEACGDFPRVNPFDEGAKVSVVVSGPDVVTAIGDTVIFHAKSVQGESLDQLAYWSAELPQIHERAQPVRRDRGAGQLA